MKVIRDVSCKCNFLVSSVNIRKVKTTIDNLYLEKQKMEKGDKQKKKTGGAGKVRTKLRVEDDVSLLIN